MKLSLSFLALALTFSPLLAQAEATLEVDDGDVSVAGGGHDNHGGPGRTPFVDSKSLQSHLKLNNLLGHARQLEKFSKLSNNTRAFGSKGHNATVAYIKKLLDGTGYYDTYLETFPYTYAESKVQVSIEGTSTSASPFTYGPSGEVEGPLVVVSNDGCVATDYPEAVAGNIALILRGNCPFGLKVAFAGGAGAAGAIIYNNADGGLGSGGTLSEITRPEGPYVPVAGISGLQGKALVAKLAEGTEVVANVKSTGFSETRYSSNVIATTKAGDKNNVIFAGAHSDSVPAGPGINDDGSGTITLLEIALKLPKYRVKNAVRFGWWTAEEFGLVGSEYHVEHLSEEARQKIALYLNFDMLASPNSGYFVHDGDGDVYGPVAPAGSEHIEKTLVDFYTGRNLTSAAGSFSGSSDYDAFLQVGIPVGGLLAGASGLKTAQGVEWWGGQAGVAYDVCYHLLCDTVENLRTEVWEVNTKATAHAIATYALSTTGIPREKRASVSRLSYASMSWDERRHLGCDHETHDI